MNQPNRRNPNLTRSHHTHTILLFCISTLCFLSSACTGLSNTDDFQPAEDTDPTPDSSNDTNLTDSPNTPDSPDSPDTLIAICGNGLAEPGETCDDANTNDGDYCSPDCLNITGRCGDNVIQLNEDCEGDNLNNTSCTTLSFDAGTLSCNPDCSFNTNQCSGCGNNTLEPGETCDPPSPFLDCPYGEPACSLCGPSCTYISGNPRTCGDGTTNGPESCDDANTTTEPCNYGDTSCTVCDSSCQNAPGSTSFCGDAIVNGPESCDGPLNPSACNDHNFTTGQAVCNTSCSNEDTSLCALPSVASFSISRFESTPFQCALLANKKLACWGDNLYQDLNSSTVAGLSYPPPGDFKHLSVAADYACAVLESGEISCWGHHLSPDDPATPPSSGTFSAVETGTESACGLKTDGSVVCWGNDFYGQRTDVPPGVIFSQITTGIHHICGIVYDLTPEDGGLVRCWGRNDEGAATPPADVSFLQISAGDIYTCGIQATNRRVTCWGSQPTSPPATQTFSKIATGKTHACGLINDATPDDGSSVLCWGDSADNKLSPPAGINFVSLDAGETHTCGVRPNGQVDCWGKVGQVRSPTAMFDLQQIYAGGSVICGLLPTGNPVCAGAGTLLTSAPAGPYTRLSIGDDPTGFTSAICGLRTNGSITCWGTPPVTVGVPSDANHRSVDTDNNHACAIDTDGAITCWGNPVGIPTNPSTSTFDQVSVGTNYACALDVDGAVGCWGDHTTFPGSGGIDPLPGATLSTLSVGKRHGCGIEKDTTPDDGGNIRCWGDNGFNQAPLFMPGNFLEVSAGDTHTCAIDSLGSLQCWGFGQYGEIVNSALGERFMHVGVSKARTCAVRENGELVCWGSVARSF